MRSPLIFLTAITLAFFLFPNNTAFAKKPFNERERLTGDWERARTGIENNGVSIDLAYIADIGSVAGGEDDKSLFYLGNLDLAFTVDTEKTGLWQGGTFYTYFLFNHGDDPSQYVGDIQVTSNIETYNSTRLYEFWYEHFFMDGDLSVLGGLHDLNSDFFTTEYGGLFINSSFGIQPDVAGNVPLSIFNVTAPAVRVKGKVTDSITLLAGII